MHRQFQFVCLLFDVLGHRVLILKRRYRDSNVNECNMENGQMRNIIRVNREKEENTVDVNE